MSAQRKDNWAAGKLYEPYVGRWSRLVAKDFLQWLGLPSQLDWLDVGCGTGALTQTILQQVQPRSVTGIDPSAGFIDYAKAQINDPRVTFEVADAQSLPVQSAHFDVAVSGLVLNFVPKPLLAAQEMARAVRPEGVVAAYVWDYAGKMELMRYFWDAAVALDPEAVQARRSNSLSDLPTACFGCVVQRSGTARCSDADDRCPHHVSGLR